MSAGPVHIAMIMDGNGRWAKARGAARIMGHRSGAQQVERVMEWCRDAGVKYLTLYAFSTENWKRSEEEVSGLMKLLGGFLKSKRGELVKERVRFRVVGRRGDLAPGLVKQIEEVEAATAEFTEFHLILAISYGGRAEIAEAARRYALAVKRGEAEAGETLEEAEFAKYLYAPDVPDPDLIVRTSGEFRLSNFLLWQSAYAEFWATDALWPDFSREDFDEALAAFGRRERRMGGRLK